MFRIKGERMIRLVSIVIVIWGLVIQPLVATAIPTNMARDNGSAHLPIIADVTISVHADGQNDDSSLAMENSSKAPCHEKSPEEASPEHCDNCDDNCANGSCSSSCTMGSSPTAFQKISADLGLNSSSLIITTNGAISHRLPSRIFHPPKHS